ncbi:LOW QUALITY PROTEIN: cation-transporting ATPase 13A2 [Leucoraja erinacea]|uniref:LOW QUALITY PROTEIN: cation-transporting ATPase 13A2 n=1 Tax=Leucoraja erinaceus TaxID=7782 RepID=UPI002454FBAC|nr:LOW QUALITY PROTEIN: cation-transporting ATPase 13A2 [Leucoraja erinacea]
MDADSSKLLKSQPSGYGTVRHSGTTVSMEVTGYKQVRWRVILCHILTALTVGILWLVFYWKPVLEVLFKCNPCHLCQSDWVVIKDSFNQRFIERVRTEEIEDDWFAPSAESSGDDMRTTLAIGVLEDDWKDTLQLQKQEEKSVIRYYTFEGLRYIWIEKKGSFCKLSDLDESLSCEDIHKQQKGLSTHNQIRKRQVYGRNVIEVLVKSYFTLLVQEVLNPFYIFQIFSIILWVTEEYYYYAVCILFISVISIGISLYQTRKQSVTLRNMVKLTLNVQVRRDTGEVEMVNSQHLVPGDCIVIAEDGVQVPCDAALLTGECMVNESMLTGESVPVMKTPLPDQDVNYSSEEHKRHTLFCGTQVVQSKSYSEEQPVLAVVVRTGFCTSKGELISSILYPKPLGFKFYKDAMKFIIFLGVLALIGDIYSIVILEKQKVSVGRVVTRILDLITIIIPPALPAAMTVGTIYAQDRLKKYGIFCISPPRINICGKLKLICFDKTGTLTEEGLDYWGVALATDKNFDPIIHDTQHLGSSRMLHALATCHSVTLLNNQPIGDPLDLKMIESTGWTLNDEVTNLDTSRTFGMKVLAVMKPPLVEEQPYGSKQDTILGIIRHFPFASSLQRMSVITKKPDDSPFEVYLKGAPEMVASLCLKETVPADFLEVLRYYAKDGYRILGLAHKTLNQDITFEAVHMLERNSVESELTFLGFLIMKNILKPETKPVIDNLIRANFRTVMVTGDNMLTALNVARNCGMVGLTDKVIFANASPPLADKPACVKFLPSDPAPDLNGTELQPQPENHTSEPSYYHFALNGKSFAVIYDHFPDLLEKILLRGTVYARMAPNQKTQLVESLQKLEYTVGMCGDGANDCGALKAADAGISLSDSEASVASPFTSKIDNIECVPMVIREGRASLITSFGVFKYMAMYSMIQFVSVLILYTINSNLGDWQYLYFDLVITTTVAILMGRTGPAKALVAQRPVGSLINITILGSLLLQTVLVILIQVLTYTVTATQSWFVPATVSSAGNKLPNYENTALFCISGFQYLILATVLSKGQPFRKPLYSNVLFLVALILLYAVMIFLTLYPLQFMRKILQLMFISDLKFKLLLLGFAALQFFVSFLFEIAIDNGFLNICKRPLCKRKSSQKLYKRLDKELCYNLAWPPLNEIIYAESRNIVIVE